MDLPRKKGPFEIDWTLLRRKVQSASPRAPPANRDSRRGHQAGRAGEYSRCCRDRRGRAARHGGDRPMQRRRAAEADVLEPIPVALARQDVSVSVGVLRSPALGRRPLALPFALLQI